MIKYACLIVYILVGIYFDNKVVNDIVAGLVLSEFMSDPETYSVLDIDKMISVMQVILGIVFVIFWPVFFIMWTFNTIIRGHKR